MPLPAGLQVLAADGVFDTDGTFPRLPPVSEILFAEGFRCAALGFLTENRASADGLRSRLFALRHRGGFVAHSLARVEVEEQQGRMGEAQVTIPRQSRGLSIVSRSKRLIEVPNENAAGAA